MMGMLEDFLQKSLVDGYAGLWATGDMTWELGPERDFSNLVEYEWRLEEFLRTHAQIGGICQYRADALPQEALRKGLLTHRGVFISETLSMVNPHYLPAESFPAEPARELELHTSESTLQPGIRDLRLQASVPRATNVPRGTFVRFATSECPLCQELRCATTINSALGMFST